MTTEEKQIYTDLIGDSFITPQKKEALLLLLDNEELSSELFKAEFEKTILEEFEILGIEYEKREREYMASVDTLNNTKEQERVSLEKQVEQKLATLPPHALVEREKVLNEYYTTLKEIDTSHQKALQDLIDNIPSTV